MEKTDKTFREITGKRLSNTSFLNQFDIFDDEINEVYFLNFWRSYYIVDEIKNNDDYITYYSVEESSWWDNIAYELYGNENLWWIIAMTNDVVNPFEQLEPGEQIKVIDRNFLYSILKEVKNISEM